MWLYTIPVAIALPLFVGAFVGVSLLIVLALRKLVPHDPNRSTEWDRVLGYVVAVYGVLYGVTLALIAAASYENYRGVEELVLAETSSIAVLYRDASGFPEPTRSELQTLLVEYAEHVIDVDWVTQGVRRDPFQHGAAGHRSCNGCCSRSSRPTTPSRTCTGPRS